MRCLFASVLQPLALSAALLVICGPRRFHILPLQHILASFDVCEAMLLKGWLLLSPVLLPGCTCLLAPSLNAAPRGISAASGTGDDVSDAMDVINKCARDRSAKPDDVAAASVLRAERPRPPTRCRSPARGNSSGMINWRRCPSSTAACRMRGAVWDLDGERLTCSGTRHFCGDQDP